MPRTGTEIKVRRYPRVYRPEGFWKIAFLLFGVVLVLGPGAGLWFAATGNLPTSTSRIVLASLCIVGMFGGVYCLLYVVRSKVTLLADRISFDNLTGPRELLRHEIRGWRILPTNPSCLVLEPSGKGASKMKIGLTFPIDDVFENWLDPLPCLDEEDRAASEKEINDDRNLGEDPADRSRSLEIGRRLARRLSIASLIICGWGLFFPKPYPLVICLLICLPWVAIEILRRSKGLFRVDEKRNDAHPSVAYALIFPCLVLALRSLFDITVLQSAKAYVLYASVGAILVIFAAKFDATLWARKPVFAIFCAIGLAYGFGTVTEVDVIFDRSTGNTYSAVVEGKHVTHGKQTSYHLELSPWGPKTAKNRLDVRRATYDLIECGDTAQITLRSGALGLNWYYLRTCQRTANSLPCK